MALSKRLLKHPLVQSMLAWVLANYIRLVYLTSSKQFDYHVNALPYMRGETNAIFAFWHGRMMLCPTIRPPNHVMHVLISMHRDGRLISDTVRHLNVRTISGSTSRGAQAASSEIIRTLERGDNIGITPDGPRGPVHVAAPGVAAFARLSGKPVLPVIFSSTRAKQLGSWDRFMLALPFGHIVFCVGAPIMVEQDADEERSRLLIEQAMNALLEKADGMVNA